MAIKDTDLIVKQVDDGETGVPVLECNGLHYALDLTGAVWKLTKPDEDADPPLWTSSVTIGDWKLEATFLRTKANGVTTISNVTYTAGAVEEE